MTKITVLLTAFCLGSLSAIAQLTFPADGGNKKASVSERIGLTDVTIHYDRPAVKGREGKVWGELVHYGFKDLGFGTSKESPWRAGANENTTITVSTDVAINGKPLTAGTYGLLMAVQENDVTVIFSKNSTSWGSYFYDPKEDALRVTVKPLKDRPSVERLKYEFTNETDSSAVVMLEWEKWAIPFTVSVNLVQTQLASLRNELRGEKGFRWDAYQQAAAYIADHKTNLEEGLRWADYSINGQFVGEKNFNTLSTKARLLSLMNRSTEADALIKEALPLATLQQAYQYGRQLINQKRTKEAMALFQDLAKKYPNVFMSNMGLMRAYSAMGDYKTAADWGKKALALAPDANNKANVERLLGLLGQGKDVN
ncbi:MULTISPECIES: DUF2911 domain-containing protein [unclassified Spirosoma]|uniref:DUF2911 domain-containing protein n=1 Tax=unclassified Spirosoma TaxID=2621999 RepID=UPI00095E1439|nr:MULTISPECIES: DUF2911 domain-containing protein [unclassified Spirosoma]MBN8826266.1 DUF2911 domain-containing protein [Spirosoma sp.]OJW75171.1 MAG: hypothetical protein BGO59_17895 [Spirosoma sp. 48-14]